MRKGYLVSNKETKIADYLEHRSILEIVEEHRTLTEVNLEQISIVDVDELVYIRYRSDDGDLSFRADLNALRVLLTSPFFHVTEAIFILVELDDPLLEDLIMSALRDTPLTRDKVDIHYHDHNLLLQDVGKYIAGSALGQETTSTYREVYIREADLEEKERFVNKEGDIRSVLPMLTDSFSLYRQRSNVEAISAGRQVIDLSKRPQATTDFTQVGNKVSLAADSYVITGERWTIGQNAVRYLIDYYRTVGTRCLVINLDSFTAINPFVGEATVLNLMDIKSPITPSLPMALLNVRFDQLGYVIEFIRNVKGVEQYIFYTEPGRFRITCRFIHQFSEVVKTLFVAHYSEDSVKRFIDLGVPVTALFLTFRVFNEEFNLKQFKRELKGTVVAQFPDDEDVDLPEFFVYANGGIVDEE